MDMALVMEYTPAVRPSMPYPWQPYHDRNGGVSTVHYARMVLDALAGDDRRKDLRRLYRMYIEYVKSGDLWRNASYYMLVEALYRLYDLFPLELLNKYLQPVKSEVLHGLVRASVKTVRAERKAGNAIPLAQ